EDEGRAPKERKQLEARSKALEKKYQREWLGELAEYILDRRGLPEDARTSRDKFQFGGGWLDSLQIAYLTADFVQALGPAPRARLPRRLTVEWLDDYELELAPLIKPPALANLRVLTLGEGSDRTHMNGQGVVALVRKLPRLEELYLHAHGTDTDKLFKMKLENVRVLVVDCNTHYPLERLAANASLSRLT